MYLLIDGDGIIYRCGFAVEKTKYLVTKPVDIMGGVSYTMDFADDHKTALELLGENSGYVWSRKEVEPVENAFALVNGVLHSLPEHTGMEIWLSPPVGNFREAIATKAKYKGNRDTAQRPKYYREIAGYLVERYGARYTEGQEADDALGIRATQIGDKACIVSFDKDLLQVPGLHYNWVTKEQQVISKREGAFNFYQQILSGDPTDNVPGLRGVGPAKARKILADVASPAEAWSRIVAAYDGDESSALETARLVYVRRKDGEIWNPPSEKAADSGKAGTVRDVRRVG